MVSLQPAESELMKSSLQRPLGLVKQAKASLLGALKERVLPKASKAKVKVVVWVKTDLYQGFKSSKISLSNWLESKPLLIARKAKTSALKWFKTDLHAGLELSKNSLTYWFKETTLPIASKAKNSVVIWYKTDLKSSVSSAQKSLESFVETSDDSDIGIQPSKSLAGTITWTLIATSVASFAWLALAKTDEVIIAKGRLQPIGDVKIIQMPLGGVLKEMLVTDGQRVSSGQVLLRLDNEASLDRAKSTSEAVRAKKAQLKLKQTELERYLSLNDARMKVLRRKVELNRLIAGRIETLYKEGAAPELQYLQQLDELAEVEGELETTSIIRERQLSIINQSIEELKGQLANVSSDLTELNVNLRYQDITSPVDGVIFDLKPTGPGFVAQSSEPVMKVVPFDALQAKINIKSSDIGFVKVGKPVDISIDSFPANDFGVVQGTLERIGSDALPPDKQNQFYRYPSVIKLNSQQLKLRSGKQLPLQAGMSLTANIKLRKVTWLQLLLGGFKDKTDALKGL